ncbi:MAG: cobalt ECF transporter T component CbiQ [Clostridiales bacterium]|nr:cobalt ECF transporter T component CbiQ [Clostridiales bacterium]
MIFSLLLAALVLFLLLYGLWETALIGLIIVCLLFGALLLHRGHFHHHGGYISIDLYAQKSRLCHWHSGAKLIFCLVCAFISVWAKNIYVPVFIFCAMSFLTLALGKTPVSYYLSLLTVPAVFILLSALAIIIEISPIPEGVLCLPAGSFYLCVTKANQEKAAGIMLSAFGAVSCLYMLSLSTPIYRIFEALRKMRLPFVVIELMYLIYRYLFILLETHQNMVYSAASRLGYRSPVTSLKTMLNTSFNLFFTSLRRASGMYDAMEARCYDGEIRFLMEDESFDMAQVFVFLSVPAAAVLIWIMSRR